jgi:hypothetical protein
LTWLGFDRNPLRRRSDRIESVVLMTALLVSVAALPFAVLLGISVQDSLQREAERQALNRLPVAGTVVEEAPTAVTAAAKGSGPEQAQVAWTTPDGVERTDTVTVPSSSHPGSEVTVWTTPDGRLTAPPLTSSQVAADAVAVAAAGQLAVMGLAWMAFRGVRHALDRRRYRLWDAEWLRVTRES